MAPKLRATGSFRATMSTATMGVAPASAAPWIAFTPTPPAPMTTALLPGVSWAVLRTAPTPVMTPQARRHARSSPRSAGMTTSCDWSTTTDSANPATRMPALSGWPVRLWSRCSVMSANCPSQRYAAPVRQGPQPPQVRRSETTTRSPGRTRVTPGPTSLTTPAASWPATTGGGVLLQPAQSPRIRCTSL